MASNKNTVEIEGNLVRDPVLRTTPSGHPVCNFSIASNRFHKKGDEFEKETSFFDVQCWSSLADYVNGNFRKGNAVEVKGRLKQERWTTPQGENREKVVIVADSVTALQRQGKQQHQDSPQKEEYPF